MGSSPAHKPSLEKEVKVVTTSVVDKAETARTQTLEFLKYESEYSAQIDASVSGVKDQEKVCLLPNTLSFFKLLWFIQLYSFITNFQVSPKESPVISAKARQFIETVPEDDSVQECFFSKRIYSDSLEDSEHTDSRRHSEAESLKSDQSDVKAKVSSSDFDERAEYEEIADSGSGFGDEKFEESVGFTSMRIESKALELEKQDSESDKEPDVVFKKVTKRHSRTESVSISKLSDLQTDESPKLKQEFQMFVTEAEEVDRSFDKDETSDKISSESSREIEMSDRKSSEGISDKISSEDAVTDKKTSSEEDAIKDGEHALDLVKDITKDVKEVVRETERVEIKSQVFKEEVTDKGK